MSDLDDLLGSGPDFGDLAGPVDIGGDFDMDDILDEPQESTADPLAGVEYTGDLAQDSAAELTALQQGYRDRAKQEAERFKNATDSEFWFAVCFKTREEKEAFLTKHNLADLGDKYLDGNRVDRALSK